MQFCIKYHIVWNYLKNFEECDPKKIYPKSVFLYRKIIRKLFKR